MPDYLYAALSRDADENLNIPEVSDLVGNKLFAGLIDENWERVQLVRPSTTSQGEHWVVYAVDIGLYHMVKRNQMRKLGESTIAFDKMLLAKCKVIVGGFWDSF